MSDELPLPSWVNWIPATWQALRTLAQRHTIAVVLVIVLLSCGFPLVMRAWQRAQVSERVLTETLGADFEPAPEENKGLEAFLFSDPAMFTLREKLRAAKISAPLRNSVQNLEAAWSRRTFTANFKLRDLCSTKNLCPKIDRVTRDGDVVLSDSSPLHYLFLPATVLRARLTDEDRAQLVLGHSAEDYPFLNDDFNSDPALLTDLAASGYVADSLQEFLREQVTDDEELATPTLDQTGIDVVPIRAYLVTRDGVLRIANSQANDVHHYYENHFPTNHFFPDRFYYVGALKHPSAAAPTTLDDFFYVSRPYTDLEGSALS